MRGKSPHGMPVVAGRFAGPDLMALDAGHAGRLRRVMRDEEYTARAVAELAIFSLQP
jgi:hypothetical protein